jgi:hypothetical protein
VPPLGPRAQNLGYDPNPLQKRVGGYFSLIFCDVIVAAGGHVDFNLTDTTAGNLSRRVRSLNTVSFKETDCVGGL